jgi:8-oxo-dGTP pyrophosphatase MutT (NUDIX family)
MRPLSARARDQLESWDGTVAVARQAATVVVTRERAGGLEVLLLRRQPTMAFAAGMHVFPGGSVHDTDRDPAPWAGPDAQTWGQRLRCEVDLARALVVAAVRETFEETGILIAGPDAETVLGVCAGEEWAVDRLQLESGGLAMGTFLRRRGLVLRADLLAPWAHWITPDFEPRRFDTRFFVVVLPEANAAHSHSTEADASFWVGVEAAVRAAERGRLAMMPPTLHTLRELAVVGREGLAAIIAGRAERDLVTIAPRLVEIDGEIGLSSVEGSVVSSGFTPDRFETWRDS